MELYWTSTVYAVIAFLILYWLLSKYAFGPLFGIMEKRRSLIQDQIDTAEQNRTESERLLNEQKQQLEKARKEAFDIIEQSKQTSSKQADEIIQKAKSEAVRIKEDALKDIENEKSKAITELRNEVSAMSIMIAAKIMEQQVDEASQKQLIDKYLQEVGGNL